MAIKIRTTKGLKVPIQNGSEGNEKEGIQLGMN